MHTEATTMITRAKKPQPGSSAYFLLALFALVNAACSDAQEVAVRQSRSAVIYGSDNRVEAREYPHAARRTLLTDATVALFPSDSVLFGADGDVRLNVPNLGEAQSLCSDERFFNQPTLAGCSGVLVAPDLILTAGHCIDEVTCADVLIAHRYSLESDDQRVELSQEQLYSCTEVIGRAYSQVLDYALVRLDRELQGANAVRLRHSRAPLEQGATLEIAGHPSGLPLKIADGASVRNPRATTVDYFLSDLDSFPGNSGSPVLSADGLLAGIVTRGPAANYAFDPQSGCTRALALPQDAPLSIHSVYTRAIVDDFCQSQHDPTVCSCGNGVCETELAESSSACPEDCGTTCGDGVCNGEESRATCYEDCGSCGDQVCDKKEIDDFSCCQDCACPDGLSCRENSCGLALGNVNGDHLIDEADVSLLSETWIAERRPITSDVTCDGIVDSNDAVALSEFIDTSAPLPCHRVKEVALGSSHTCALLESGRVYCFGDHSFGQTGMSHSGQDALLTPVDLGGNAIQIVAGSFHSCALLDTGVVRCWGIGALGQLGTGNTQNIGDNEVPSSSPGLKLGRAVTQLAAGSSHTCALLENGSVKCWGVGSLGQLGYGNTNTLGDDEDLQNVPAVQLGGSAVQLAAGMSHTCALLATGSLRCWGANFSGQLGLGRQGNVGDLNQPDSVAPVALGEPAKQVIAGGQQTCALLDSGTVRCFGDNFWGQLGYGHNQRIGDDEHPTEVAPVDFGEAVQLISMGQNHFCALLESGVKCIGQGSFGQLGDGAASPFPQPRSFALVPAIGLDRAVISLSAGETHTCAVLNEGQLQCWGRNNVAQLGYRHSTNIGDDELPASEGHSRLLQAPVRPWRWHDSGQVAVYVREDMTDQQGSNIALYLENIGAEALENLNAELFFRVHADGHLASQFTWQDHYTPWTTQALKINEEHDAMLLLLFERLLGAGQLSSWGASAGEKFKVHFNDWSTGWNVSDDYTFYDLVPGTWIRSERVQIRDNTGALLLGWTRETSDE